MQPPPSGWIKYNFDGPSKGNPGMAGARGVFGDQEGNIVGAIYQSLGHKYNNQAELDAKICGVKESLKQSFKNVIFESDSRLIIVYLNRTI
jgi:ribonuclease HI